MLLTVLKLICGVFCIYYPWLCEQSLARYILFTWFYFPLWLVLSRIWLTLRWNVNSTTIVYKQKSGKDNVIYQTEAWRVNGATNLNSYEVTKLTMEKAEFYHQFPVFLLSVFFHQTNLSISFSCWKYHKRLMSLSIPDEG
jgi:hypothetical protein